MKFTNALVVILVDIKDLKSLLFWEHQFGSNLGRYIKFNFNIWKNNIYTLGICNDETASACLFIDGLLISAVSEERFSRKKYDNSFPIKSITYLLNENNIKLSRVDYVSYSWSKGFDPKLRKKYNDKFSY